MRGVATTILLVLLTGGCSTISPAPSLQRQIVSPNGEPLGRAESTARCEERLEAWFQRVDQNRDGRLSDNEWLADADAWFARIDADRDGFATVSELTLIRRSLDPAEPAPPPQTVRRGRSPTIIDRSPDPVMAADTNLDFRVSAAEFRLLSEKRYALKAREGAPDRMIIMAECRRY
ncbi:MAG: hypothetical protein ACK4GK_05120 [Ferrovibrio sp.]|jgi:hypothetical protein